MSGEPILYYASERLIALAVLGLLLLAGEIGFRLGRTMGPSMDATGRAQLPGIQAALLGLLALLLGFTTSMAVSRFDTRQHLVVQEANAIGTAALRAQLAPGVERQAIGRLLRDYVNVRLEFYDGDAARQQAARADAERLQEELWSRAADVVRQDPRAVTNSLLLQALNDVIDLYTERLEALANRVPVTVILLIAAVAMISMGGVCFGYGLGGHRHFYAVLTLAIAVALVLMAILDLDRPREGLIRVREQSMIDLQAHLRATPP